MIEMLVFFMYNVLLYHFVSFCIIVTKLSLEAALTQYIEAEKDGFTARNSQDVKNPSISRNHDTALDNEKYQ